MDAGVVVALVTAIPSFLGVVALGILQYRQARSEREAEAAKARLEREAEAEKLLGRYRRPLAAAAYDLQRRLFNILDLDPGFLGAYMTPGSKRECDAIESTLHRFAQYFGWTEILRRDIQFLDFREPEDTQEVAALQAQIAHKFATDELPRSFMLWQDEQRAIGEIMIIRHRDSVDCLGYAAFFEQRKRRSWPWLDRLESELRTGDARSSQRLLEIQHLLYALVDLLDKDKVLDRSRLRRARDKVQ